MSYNIKHAQIRAINEDVIVYDMDFGEIVTAAGIVIKSDDGKVHGIKPRWAKVYKVGPKQQDVRAGQWVLVEHGRWTRKIKIDDGDGVKEVQKLDLKGMLVVADEKPSDVYLGTEYGHGDSATIRPEDFM